MIRRIKIIALVFLLSIVTISLVCMGILFFYKNEIAQIIINELNKNIETEIKVENTDFTLIKSFPNAGLHFYNISIASSKQYKQSNSAESLPLLQAQKVSIHFNLYQLLFRKYIVQGVRIENGKINIITSIKGSNNYQFYKNKSKNSSNKIESRINKIILKNIELNIKNAKDNYNIKTDIKSFSLFGYMNPNEQDIKLKLILNNASIDVNNKSYSINNEININSKILNKNSIVAIDELLIQILDIQLNMEGKIDQKQFNFQIKTGKTKTNDIAKLLNDLNLYKLRNTEGTIEAKLRTKGNIENGNFSIAGFITLSEIQTTIAEKYNLKQINGTLQINKNTDNHWELKTDKLTGFAHSSEFNLSGKLGFPKNPSLETKIKFSIKPADINLFIDSTLCVLEKGEILANLNFKSRTTFSFEKTFNESDFDYNLQLIGENISGNILANYLKLNNLSTQALFRNDSLYIDKLSGNFNSNHLRCSGILENVIKSIESKSNCLNIYGKLYSESLNLNSLVYSDTSESPVQYKGEINVECAKMTYEKMDFQQFKSNIYFDSNQYHFSNLSTRLCGGLISNGDITYSENKLTTRLKTNLDFKNLSIQEIFKDFENFGQSQLIESNVAGKLSGNINNTMVWENSRLLKNLLSGETTFEILDGELNNFKPVQKLSSFLEIDDINHIKFNKIKNKLKINNGIVTIPYMDIQSSALNISLSGQHSLENEYEYHFSLLLSEILLKKAKHNIKRDQEFGQVEEDTLGRTRIFIKLSGKDENYKISYDTKQALQTFTNRLKNEKQTLKQLFKDELFKQNYEQVTPTEINTKKTPQIESEEFKPVKKEEKPKKKKASTKIEWTDE